MLAPDQSYPFQKLFNPALNLQHIFGDVVKYIHNDSVVTEVVNVVIMLLATRWQCQDAVG